jgi:hypothetical protein
MDNELIINQEQLSQTKQSLKIVESLVAEYFELQEQTPFLKYEQFIRKFEVEAKLKEICLPKKKNN